MFDLSAKRDLLVKALEHFTSDKRNELIEVYTRPGSYSGFELEGDGWELVYSNIATQMGRNIVTTLKLDKEVAIRGGETQSFFIITNNFIMYDSGAVEGDVLNEDESLTIYEGKETPNNFAHHYDIYLSFCSVFSFSIILTISRGRAHGKVSGGWYDWNDLFSEKIQRKH